VTQRGIAIRRCPFVVYAVSGSRPTLTRRVERALQKQMACGSSGLPDAHYISHCVLEATCERECPTGSKL